MTQFAIVLLSALVGSCATIACAVGVIYFAGREERKELELEQARVRGAGQVHFMSPKTERGMAPLAGGPQEHLS